MGILNKELRPYKSVFVVCDRNVEAFAASLGDYPRYALDASEKSKVMDSVLDICRWLLSQDADRQALVLSVGGGVTTDVAGFAASIYKRGVRYANVPTTLLAMVDAGLGGKTGVNLDGYKNILGVIRQPEFTAILPEVLETLPRREFLSGAAEMLKTFIIGDARAYREAVALLSGPELPIGDERFHELIYRAAAIKQGIVEKDEFEGGIRRKLNLGHTWAHAIEWYIRSEAPDNAAEGLPDVCEPEFTHGEAVAIGIIQAAKMAEDLGIAEPGLSSSLESDFKACGLPVKLPCPSEELLGAIRKDKKAKNGRIAWVLPVRVGKVVIKLL